LNLRPPGPEPCNYKLQVLYLVSLRGQKPILPLAQLYRSCTEGPRTIERCERRVRPARGQDLLRVSGLLGKQHGHCLRYRVPDRRLNRSGYKTANRAFGDITKGTASLFYDDRIGFVVGELPLNGRDLGLCLLPMVRINVQFAEMAGQFRDKALKVGTFPWEL